MRGLGGQDGGRERCCLVVTTYINPFHILVLHNHYPLSPVQHVKDRQWTELKKVEGV